MKGKVLIIEDNEVWQNILKEPLESDGFFVEVVNNLDEAVKKVNREKFHFITIDMQLHNDTTTPEQYEGWNILEIIKKLRIQIITPCMVITAFGANYLKHKGAKKVESLFFMDKSKFDEQAFLDKVNEQVQRINLRFKDDHRGD